MSAAWKNTQLTNVEIFVNAREQLHQAIQVAAAVGRTYLPKVKDDHFANFLWNPEVEMLQGHTIEADESFSAALELKSLSLHLLNNNHQSIASFPLDGKTQKEVLIWLEEGLVGLGLDGTLLTIQLPYEIPPYPTAKGKAFEIDSKEAFSELSWYFGNTNTIVEELMTGEEGASDIRCWPHHFDIASLITLNDTGDPETSTSIGVGMSPGDSGYNEPYYYLTPWPYPPVDQLTEMNGPGKWHIDGWVGGVLTASSLLLSDPSQQYATVKDFFEKGISTLKGLLSH